MSVSNVHKHGTNANLAIHDNTCSGIKYSSKHFNFGTMFNKIFNNLDFLSSCDEILFVVFDDSENKNAQNSSKNLTTVLLILACSDPKKIFELREIFFFEFFIIKDLNR